MKNSDMNAFKEAGLDFAVLDPLLPTSAGTAPR